MKKFLMILVRIAVCVVCLSQVGCLTPSTYSHTYGGPRMYGDFNGGRAPVDPVAWQHNVQMRYGERVNIGGNGVVTPYSIEQHAQADRQGRPH